MQEDRETAASSDARKAQEAVAAGMEAYLGTEATGASHEEAFAEEAFAEEAFAEEAFARALGRAVERYLDSLEGEERVRVLLGLHRPGVRIPEERLLPEDPGGRKRTLEAAARLRATGKLRRVRSREDGRIFWVKVAEGDE